MGLKNSPDIFQEKMSELITGLEFVRVYIDYILCITHAQNNVAEIEANVWERHLAQLEKALERSQDVGLKVNAKKSFFGKHELEHLGNWVTRDGIQPL